MLEAQHETKLVEAAKRLGFQVRKVCWFGHRGAPDRLFLKPGRGVFIELKKADGSPSKMQEREIRLMRSAGFEVHLCYSWEAAVAVLEGGRA